MVDITELALFIDAYANANKVGLLTAYHECCDILKREKPEDDKEFHRIKAKLFEYNKEHGKDNCI